MGSFKSFLSFAIAVLLICSWLLFDFGKITLHSSFWIYSTSLTNAIDDAFYSLFEDGQGKIIIFNKQLYESVHFTTDRQPTVVNVIPSVLQCFNDTSLVSVKHNLLQLKQSPWLVSFMYTDDKSYLVLYWIWTSRKTGICFMFSVSKVNFKTEFDQMSSWVWWCKYPCRPTEKYCHCTVVSLPVSFQKWIFKMTHVVIGE